MVALANTTKNYEREGLLFSDADGLTESYWNSQSSDIWLIWPSGGKMRYLRHIWNGTDVPSDITWCIPFNLEFPVQFHQTEIFKMWLYDKHGQGSCM